MIPSKNFNLVLPFSTYKELKKLSVELEKPIARIIRQGIEHVLKCDNGSNQQCSGSCSHGREV